MDATCLSEPCIERKYYLVLNIIDPKDNFFSF